MTSPQPQRAIDCDPPSFQSFTGDAHSPPVHLPPSTKATWGLNRLPTEIILYIIHMAMDYRQRMPPPRVEILLVFLHTNRRLRQIALDYPPMWASIINVILPHQLVTPALGHIDGCTQQSVAWKSMCPPPRPRSQYLEPTQRPLFKLCIERGQGSLSNLDFGRLQDLPRSSRACPSRCITLLKALSVFSDQIRLLRLPIFPTSKPKRLPCWPSSTGYRDDCLCDGCSLPGRGWKWEEALLEISLELVHRCPSLTELLIQFNSSNRQQIQRWVPVEFPAPDTVSIIISGWSASPELEQLVHKLIRNVKTLALNGDDSFFVMRLVRAAASSVQRLRLAAPEDPVKSLQFDDLQFPKLEELTVEGLDPGCWSSPAAVKGDMPLLHTLSIPAQLLDSMKSPRVSRAAIMLGESSSDIVLRSLQRWPSLQSLHLRIPDKDKEMILERYTYRALSQIFEGLTVTTTGEFICPMLQTVKISWTPVGCSESASVQIDLRPKSVGPRVVTSSPPERPNSDSSLAAAIEHLVAARTRPVYPEARVEGGSVTLSHSPSNAE